MTYQEALAELGERISKQVGPNTLLEKRGLGWPPVISLRVYNTDVILWKPTGRTREYEAGPTPPQLSALETAAIKFVMVFNTGGFRTNFTRDRINAYLSGRWQLGFHNRVLYWHEFGVRRAPFNDGDQLNEAYDLISFIPQSVESASPFPEVRKPVVPLPLP